MIKWYLANKKADYAALAEKNAEGLYFIKDTGEIYLGEQSYTQSVIFYGTGTTPEARPEKGAFGKLYIDITTLQGFVWNGTEYKEVIKKVETAVDANTDNPVSAKAVKTYVDNLVGTGTADCIKTVAWDETNVQLKVTKKDDSVVNVPLTKIATVLEYDGGTGNLTLKDHAGSQLSQVNIPLDNFVKSGKYDSITKEIVLTMQNANEVRIPAAALVDVYTGTTTNSGTVTVSPENQISFDIKLDPCPDNKLTVSEAGLKVTHDDGNKMDKVGTGHENEILAADATGNAKASGLKAGGATLTNNDAVTLAIEAAVEAVRASLQTNIDAKVDKTSIVAGAVNEKGADATKVVSEKAMVAALTWQTVPAAAGEEEEGGEG